MLHHFESLFQTVLQLVDRHGLWGAFWLMVIENMGIPFPTEAGFVVAVRLIRKGTITYAHALCVITAGHMLGSTVSYAIAFWGSERLEKWMSKAERWQRAHAKLRDWYARYGSGTVFLARLIGYVRPYSSFIAGFAEVPFFTFLVWTLLGTILIVAASLACTDWMARMWTGYPQLHGLMTICISIVCLGLLWASLWRAAAQKRSAKCNSTTREETLVCAEKLNDSPAG